MKKLFTMVLLLALLSACNSGVKVEQTVTATAVPQVAETTKAAEPIPTGTPVPVKNWLLAEPPSPSELPTELTKAIAYIEPPKDCSVENDANKTCSTKKGQITDSDFDLKAGQALVMTGDVIDIFREKELLVERPSLNSNHDLWVMVNQTGEDIKLHMLAPHGSFRGYFEPTEGVWNVQKIAFLRDLHLYLFLLPTQTYDRFTPTPVPNCESKDGCDEVNVRVVVFDDQGQHISDYGLYSEGSEFWKNLKKLLGL